jgi:hypothetical protein
MAGKLMPYFISQDTECPDWAVIKDDDTVIACHPDKESAIAQMVAISIEENIEPGGERKVKKGKLKYRDDEVTEATRDLPDNYRPALAEDVPEGRACGNCIFFNEDRQNEDGTKAWCERWEDFADGGYYCNAWEPKEEARDINQDAPAYMRAAARRGLEFHEQGLSGDGVTAQTIREAREMAEGRVSDDKWIRLAAWIARHLVDLDAPDADPDSEDYPSAGVVAHLLWGSGPSKRAAQRMKVLANSLSC